MNILYEDNHIIVAVKPQNIPTQEDISGDEDFLTMIKAYVKQKYAKPGDVYIGLLHRLDRPAGGVMVFARTSKAAERISKQIREGELKKEYLAIVSGEPLKSSDRLCDYLLKDREANSSKVVKEGTAGAKYAELEYKIVGSEDGVSLVEVLLKTGRSHQIRVQLQNAGAPIVGDFRYGGIKSGELCLWSHLLGFWHPTKKEWMEFSCLPPKHGRWKLFSFD